MDLSQLENTAFKTGQRVVYPIQGVGEIKRIEARKFKNKEIAYYIIYIDGSDMTLMIPIDKAERLGVRPIVSREEAEAAIRNLVKPEISPNTDWKQRYQDNMDMLKSGNPKEIAVVISMLYFRSKAKELPILERKLYDSAIKLFVDELALAFNQPKNEIHEMVFTKLEK